MIARSFKSVAWVAAIGAAALICYIFSLQVAEERARLADLEAQIRRTEQSIRTLKTELGTRGRVHQLQHWAASDFGFTSPKAGQFLDNEVTLASFDLPAEEPVMEAPVRLAEAPAPAPAAALPKPVQAAAPAPKSERAVVREASAPTTRATPLLRRAAATTATAPRARPAVAPVKPAAAPARAAAAEPRPSRPAATRSARKPASTQVAR